MENPLKVVVIAHSEAQETFNRHMPYWEAHKGDILVVCPEDSPVTTKHEILKACGKGRATIESIKRIRVLIDYLVTNHGGKHFAIFEYDSICLTPELPIQAGFSGIAQWCNQGSDFALRRYLTPPWSVDWESLNAMRSVARRFPALWESGEADRYLSALAFYAHIPLLAYEPKGFTAGTIGHEHLTALRTAIYEGATMFHGLKHEIFLENYVKRYRNEYLKEKSHDSQ